MKVQREYIIPFIGLKEGLHHYNYEIKKEFFSHFEDSQVQECSLFADVAFDKKERLFILNFDISGTIESECDRCGQIFQLPVHGNHTLYVKIGDLREEDENNEDVIWLNESESNLDVSEMLYEFIHLSIPIRKIHPDRADGTEGCDPEILKRLTENKPLHEQDPRWDVLNKLSNN